MCSSPLASLRSEARTAAQRAHVPFSGESAAAVLLLSDGAWVPGVRVESASFSLTIPPALNAFTTAVAAGRRDVVAAAFSRPMQPAERAFWADLRLTAPLREVSEDALAAEEAALPALGERLDPLLSEDPPGSPRDGIAQARAVAERALVPASQFPVGCVLAVGDALVPGVNVEPAGAADWSHVLCAERSALGTACSYGLLGAGHPHADVSGNVAEPVLYLSCLRDPAGSPCGACRQLLVELLPGGVLWMDRASEAPERMSPSTLLPGSFRGSALPRTVPSA